MTKSRSKRPKIQFPNLKELGSVRSVRRKIGGSDVIFDNRDKLAQELINLSTAKISDVLSWDEEGNIKVKPSADIPDSVLTAIKKIRIVPTADGKNAIDIELIDKVSVLRTLARASGLLDQDKMSDKPAVVEVKMVGPKDE
tara:strand:+ start:650 stop:1072 length:423 start_codon:yes stop_codon:yes gene_type:complete